MIRYIFVCILLLISQQLLKAQSRHPSFQQENVDSYWLEILEANENISEDYMETAIQNLSTPINLNAIDTTDPRVQYLFTDNEVKSLQEHIKQFGKLISIYETQSIEGWNMHTLKRILPYVEVKNVQLFDNNTTFLQQLENIENHSFTIRYNRFIEDKKGYLTTNEGNTPYLGSADKILFKWKASKTEKFSLGITAEKDAGETYENGADFLSFHAAVYNKGKIKKLILGDFQLQTGQGLLSSGGFALGKGSEVIYSTIRNDTDIRPYSSTIESNFYRGIATTIQLGKWHITPLLSYKYLDGKPESDYTTIQQTGYHRTASEVEGRKQISELIYGTSWKYTDQYFNFGGAYLNTTYSHFIESKPSDYNQFYFKGKSYQGVSINGQYNYKNFQFFGEAVQNLSENSNAILLGSISSISKMIDLAILYRYYSPDFHAFYGDGFGENSTNRNEEGIYWGIKFKPFRPLEISFYHDQFTFEWLKFQASSPSSGNDTFIKARYKFSKKINLYAQYKQEEKYKDNNTGTPIENISPTRKKDWRIHFDYGFDNGFSFRNRIQGSEFKHDQTISKGFAVLQDISYKTMKWKLQTRWAYFDTDDYNSRLYTYEPNVLYAFSFPAYYGKGIRSVYMLQCKPIKGLSIWLRYASTLWSDQDKISNGNEQIEGNQKSEIGLQLIYSP